MGICISISIPPVTVDCNVFKHYIYDLAKNLRSLEIEVEQVAAMQDDLLRRILIEEDRGHQRLPTVHVWVESARTVTRKAREFLYDERVEINKLCFYGYCSTSFKSTYKYGKKVYWLLKRVEYIRREGNFEMLTQPAIYRPASSHVLEDKVSIFKILKFSYDAIEAEETKLCFLFCCLFPNDQEMRKEELVELWIGEQIIDEGNDEDSKRLGYEIIRILLNMHLFVEAGESRDKVRMHDLVREMALYIASNPELESYTLVGRLSNIKNWRDVRRVSLAGDIIKTISGRFDCPKLKTLFLRDTNLETISREVFPRLPVLLVLDLSLNQHLNILPDTISELVSLRYLDLSSTGIKRLPPGLSELHNLAYLNLEHTHMLKDITGISNLVPSIKVLRLCDSGFRARCSLLEELQLLKHLELLTITLQDEEVAEKFLSSPKLVRCTQAFYLKYCEVLSSVSITSLSQSLQCLDVQDSYIPEMKIDHSATGGEAMITVSASPSGIFFGNLNEVRLDGCNGLRELTWLLFAPSLTTLRVVQSRDIEEIISKGKAANLNIVPFDRLEFLALEGLDKLRSIYWDPLPLPMLREIRVRSCPGLIKLPVNSESAKGQHLVVSAEKELMQRIEWEDTATKQRLFPS